MAEPPDAHDCDRVAGLDALEGVEGGGAAALEGGGVDVAKALWDGIEERLSPDGVGREAALVEVRDAVHGAIGAEGFGSLEAFDAVAATVDFVAPADVVASLQGVACWANGLDDADAFVAENHVCTFLPSHLVAANRPVHVGEPKSLT